MTLMLHELGYQVLVLDNLSTGFEEAVIGAELIRGDIHDSKILSQIFKQNNVDVVMHFAACIDVRESVRDPFKYYRNNVVGTQSLLEQMVANNVKNFIFSSTAAIFGKPEYVPIDEEHNKNPVNPYGHSKLMVEQMLDKYDQAYGIKSVCLRYFNAAGADPKTRLGECHDPETHLIPLVLQVASGRRKSISIFGNNYDTVDGTCVRDYIHVVDLCNAHLLATEFLLTQQHSQQFNLGNGNGYSVQQIINAIEQISNQPINIVHADRRAGDPPILLADSSLANKVLNWVPEFSDIEQIIKHAWKWEKQRSQ